MTHDAAGNPVRRNGQRSVSGRAYRGRAATISEFRSRFVIAATRAGARSLLGSRLFASEPSEARVQPLKLVLAQVFEVQKFITRMGQASNDFIELGVDDICVSILAALNDEHHQERHGTGYGVHNQLPCV